MVLVKSTPEVLLLIPLILSGLFKGGAKMTIIEQLQKVLNEIKGKDPISKARRRAIIEQINQIASSRIVEV